ncbi:MAG TPA: copper resistance protein CopC [Acidimicrobiia bacterium]|nr:copper resistance protein CopC [Acidimicrobiia bacterium]
MAVSVFLTLFLAVSWGWTAGPAWGHPYLVQTEPGPGVALANPPARIQIGFTEPVVLEGSSLRLEDSDGRPVPLGPLGAPKEGPGLAADITGAIGGDVYNVRWTVLSQDGHTSSGDFRFGVNGPNNAPPRNAQLLNATGGPADQLTQSDGPARIGLRWLGLFGASLLVGGAVLLARLRGRLEDGATAVLTARWTAVARLAWLLTLAGSIAAVVAAATAGEGGAQLSVLLATSTGTVAVARLVGVVLAGVPGLFGRPGPRRDQFLGMSGAFFLGGEAVSGHITAITSGWRFPAIIAQGAHLAAAAMWVGGVAVLAWGMAAVPGPARSAAVRAAGTAFRPVATISAAVVIATGVIASIREVEHRYFLVWSDYGRFLLSKWALVAGMLVLGVLVARGLGVRRRAAGPSRPPRPVSGLLRTEAVLGVAVLVFAATLAGVAQGRGQPLPAQRGSVLAGPAFANTVVGGGLVRVALSPATPGRNRVTALLASAVEAAAAGGIEQSAAVPGEQEAVAVTLACDCAAEPVEAQLTRAAGAWRADVDLPEAGVWRASLRVGTSSSLAPVALRVASGDAPGAPAYEISSIGDLSGATARRCRSFQLGLVLSLGFLNAGGGIGGRKVVVRSADDAGDRARAKELAETHRDSGVAVPCGPAAAVTAGVLQEHVPVVLADAFAAPVTGERIFRLSGDPYAEGWAAGRIVARTASLAPPDAPRRMSVLIERDDPGGDRIVAGVRAALALDPALAAAVEGQSPPSTADMEVVARTHEAGTPLFPLVQESVNGKQYMATFLATDPTALGAALDQLSDREIVSNATIMVASRAFDEAFVRSSKIGRRGDVKVFGEVAPDSGDSLLYTRLVSSIFPGEQSTIDGLRGFMAGRAIIAGLAKGSSSDALARNLAVTPLLESEVQGGPDDGLVSGWSPAAPAAGSWRFLLFKGSFIPGGLIPGRTPEPGRYFPEGGAWSRVQTGNVGLCGPQLTVNGPPPPCEAPPKN